MGNPSSARKRRFIAGDSVRFVFRSDDDETDDEQGHQKCQKQHHSNRHLSASFRVVNGLLHAWGNWSLVIGSSAYRYCSLFPCFKEKMASGKADFELGGVLADVLDDSPNLRDGISGIIRCLKIEGSYLFRRPQIFVI